MGFRVRIGPEAYQDIQQGIDWYGQKGGNLGHKFYEELENTLKII